MLMDTVCVDFDGKSIIIKDVGARTFSFHCDNDGYLDINTIQTVFELANKQLQIENQK